MDEQGDQRALADALDRFSRKADEILRQGNTNTAKIEVNAGGVGVWIATTACCVMVAASLFMGLWVVDLSRKVSELENYLNAIYMMAPSLKPEDLK